MLRDSRAFMNHQISLVGVGQRLCLKDQRSTDIDGLGYFKPRLPEEGRKIQDHLQEEKKSFSINNHIHYSETLYI